MPLNTVFRAGVKIANKVFKSAQEPVTHKQWTGQELFGDVPVYTPSGGTPRKAIVTKTSSKKRLPEGQMVNVKYVLLFLEPVLPQGTAGRDEPVDNRDVFTLADGSTLPVVYAGGGVPNDPGTHRGYALEVWLGG